MKVRKTDVSDSDIRSARLFFDTVGGFYDLSEVKVLDAFARNGQLTVDSYLGRVASIDAWELGAEHSEALVQKVGAERVRIGCSYKTASEYVGPKFDMVVIDTPQGLHKDHQDKVRAEHFDFLRVTVDRLLEDTGLVVLYVNTRPYNRDLLGSHGYDEYAEYDFEAWMAARRAFYGNPHLFYGGNEISVSQALHAYAGVVRDAGYRIQNVVVVPCYSDVDGLEPYAFRLALDLTRT